MASLASYGGPPATTDVLGQQNAAKPKQLVDPVTGLPISSPTSPAPTGANGVGSIPNDPYQYQTPQGRFADAAPAAQPNPQINAPVSLDQILTGMNGSNIGGGVTAQQFNPSSFNPSSIDPNAGQVDVGALSKFYAPNQDVLARYTDAQNQVNQRGQQAGQEINRQLGFGQEQVAKLPGMYSDAYDKFVAPAMQSEQSGVQNALKAAGQNYNDNGSLGAMQAAIGSNRASRESLTPLLAAGFNERAQAQQGSLGENLAALNAQIAQQQTGYLQGLSQQQAAAQDYATQRNAQMGASIAGQNAGFQQQAGAANAASAQQAAAANAAARQGAQTSNASIKQAGNVTPAALLASPQFKASINPQGGLSFSQAPQPSTSGLVDFGKVTQAYQTEGPNAYSGPWNAALGASVSQDPAMSNSIVNGSGGPHDAYAAAKKAITGLQPAAAAAALAKVKNQDKYPRAISLALWDVFHENGMDPALLAKYGT